MPQQRAELEAYCRRFNLVLALVLADEARSGASTVGREGFQDLMDLTADPDTRPAGLLLWNFARFTRNLDDAGFYKSQLRKRGMVIHSLTDPVPEGHWGRMVETIIDIANEEKRRQTSRDAKRALAALTREGFAPGGRPPRGYMAEQVTIGHKRDGSPRRVPRWVPDPALWELVQLAWRMRAEGHSYADIQAATRGQLYQTKNSWSSFFANRSYLGIGKCGELEVPDHHPAATDQATWEHVQSRRATIARPTVDNPSHPRRMGAPALLSGLAVCIHCGAAMAHERSNVKRGHPWPLYLCGRKRRQGWRSCQGRNVNGRRAEQAVVEAVMHQVLTPEYVAALLEEVRARMADTAAVDREIADVRAAQAVNARNIANLLDLAKLFGAKSAGVEIVREEAEQARLAGKLSELTAKRAAAAWEVTPAAMAVVVNAWQAELMSAHAAGAVHALRAALGRFVAKVELGYNVARVWYTYPLDYLLAEMNPHTETQGGGVGAPELFRVAASRAIMLTWE